MEKPLLNLQKIRVRDRPPGSPRSIFAQFQDQRNTAAMLVGRTLLATGATGVKQGVKQGESLLGGHSYAHAQYIHSVSSVPLCETEVGQRT